MKTKETILVLFLMFALLLSTAVPKIVVSASESVNNPVLIITDPDKDGGTNGNLATLCKDINEKLHKENLFVHKGIGTTTTYMDFISYEEGSVQDVILANITLNMAEYKKLMQQSKTKTIDIVLDSIADSQLNQANRTKLYNFVTSQDPAVSNLVRRLEDDIKVDIYGGYTILELLGLRKLGVILGFFTLIIFALLAVTIILDIAYIVIPAFNLFLTKVNSIENRWIHHPKFVSLEAEKAYSMACSIEGGGYISPVGAYLKMKLKHLVILCICLLYLVSGKIFMLIASVIDLFSGFLPK